MFRALEERQANDLDGGPAGHQYCLARVWLERMVYHLLRLGLDIYNNNNNNNIYVEQKMSFQLV